MFQVIILNIKVLILKQSVQLKLMKVFIKKKEVH